MADRVVRTVYCSPSLDSWASATTRVNFYLGYDSQDLLICAVAEINNTYGETHLYVLDEPLPGPTGDSTEFRADKEFFVSPFFDLRGEYRFQFGHSSEKVDVRVNLHREGRLVLLNSLWGEAHRLARGRIVSVLLRSPLSAILTMPRIAWQAWKLKRKGLRALLKPEPASPMTIRRVPRPDSALQVRVEPRMPIDERQTA